MHPIFSVFIKLDAAASDTAQIQCKKNKKCNLCLNNSKQEYNLIIRQDLMFEKTDLRK